MTVELRRAVAIFFEIGADDAERLPKIWKLRELVAVPRVARSVRSTSTVSVV